MSEPKDKPKAPKRSKRKAPMEPLGWDEIVSQPGMGGYLSFLNGPIPLPHLQPSGAGVAPSPGVDSVAAVVVDPVGVSDPGLGTPAASEASPVVAPYPEAVTAPTVEERAPDLRSSPGVKSGAAVLPTPGHIRTPAPGTTPGVISVPRRTHIRKCVAARDGHSLGEEILYQALWSAAAPETGVSRMIVIGWRGMSQLCRMTPKNCKINTQRLIRKLALEVLSPYNTPESIGTTYRIYSTEDILRRRRRAGLEWVIRSRGVEFVDPATGV
jgi:hypothetical protein